jgi:hypothetical protein
MTSSKTDIIADIKRVASRLRITAGGEFARSEYLGNGGLFSEYQLYDGGRTWGELCREAGFTTKEKGLVPDAVYFERLSNAIKHLGRYPKSSERKRFGLNFSKRRYPTLRVFIRAAIDAEYVRDLSPRDASIILDVLPTQIVNDSCKPVSPSTRNTVPAIPSRTRRKKWMRIDVPGIPYAPHDELATVALFAVLCANQVINWQILDLNGGKGIDAVCFDDNAKQEIRVEIKHIHSRNTWNHNLTDIDYVVCWENRWKDFPKPVVELSRVVQRI